MKKLLIPLFLILFSSFVFAQNTLAPELELFRPFIEKTYIGTFVGNGDTPAMTDVSQWVRALNGQAIKIIHSVNNGDYGGETILFWDKAKKQIVFYYFTTAGFYTNGTMTVEKNKFTSHEFVANNENGITEVKATSEIMPDGKMHTKSFYFQNGDWVPGHEIIYVEKSDAKVIFK